MSSLYRITFVVEQESDVVPDSVFNRLIQRPSRGLDLRGRLRWLTQDRHDVLIEGPREDIERYLEYLRVGEPIIGEISMVHRYYIKSYGLKEAFFYENMNMKAKYRKRMEEKEKEKSGDKQGASGDNPPLEEPKPKTLKLSKEFGY